MDCEWLRVPEELKQRPGLPWQIRSDNGPEFVSRAVDQWAYEPGLQWDTIQPGRPQQLRGSYPRGARSAGCELYRAELGQEASNAGPFGTGRPINF